VVDRKIAAGKVSVLKSVALVVSLDRQRTPINGVGPPDAELIARVTARGDQHAFGELVRRHQSTLRASIRKMTGNDAQADDIAQETFVLAWRNIAKFRFEARFSTWLYRIAFNAWQSEARKKSELLLDDHAPFSADGAARADDAEPQQTHIAQGSHAMQVMRAHDLARAMQHLSDAERAAITACFYNDLSHEEAAYALAMPLGTLKTHILRGREKLRQQLMIYADQEADDSAHAVAQ
jgi:RNA polymerase sigma factor (sigma-70 family)